MIGEKMAAAINVQINKELYSAYLYLAMAAQAEAMNLPGFAAWFGVQAKEEVEHAMKFFRYLVDQGARVELEGIAKPPVSFKSPADMFEKTLKHEREVTASIHSLVDLAIKENDHATQSFLRWYVDEQVEEEANVAAIVAKLGMIGDAGGPALLMLDRELGARKGD